MYATELTTKEMRNHNRVSIVVPCTLPISYRGDVHDRHILLCEHTDPIFDWESSLFLLIALRNERLPRLGANLRPPKSVFASADCSGLELIHMAEQQHLPKVQQGALWARLASEYSTRQNS